MQILIGPIVYTVVAVEELADTPGLLHGDINYGRCRIRISADDDPQLQLVTLWHEVIHGILHQAAIENHDEPTIIALSHGIVRVLRDNPDLLPAPAELDSDDLDAAVAQE